MMIGVIPIEKEPHLATQKELFRNTAILVT